MNGVVKRGVFEVGLCDVPKDRRRGMWKSFFGAMFVTGVGLCIGITLLWLLTQYL